MIIFDGILHGYYIHGLHPLGQAEGSLEYIESVFEKEAKTYGTTRAFRLDDPDQTQTFEVVFPFEVRQNFQINYKSEYIKRLVSREIGGNLIAPSIPETLNEQDYQEI